MNIYVSLFATFAKIGALTFGGGYTMLPMLEEETVRRKPWVKREDLLDYYAIGQCLPGIIAVNTALFIGHKVRGFKGGLAAALGMVFPSLIVILPIAAFLRPYMQEPLVRHAFSGIQVGVLVLIVQTLLKLRRATIIDYVTYAIFLAVFLLSVFSGLSPILLVAATALLGILLRQGRQKEQTP